jgi:hypothetical protein
VRLRLCEAGASEKDLLSVMYGYTLTGSFASEQWNPYGAPAGIDSRLGADAQPIYPRDAELSSATPTRSSVAMPRARTRTTSVDEAAEPTVQDQDAAQSLVDIPSPEIVADTPQSSDAAAGAKVVVPAPACANGNESCN